MHTERLPGDDWPNDGGWNRCADCGMPHPPAEDTCRHCGWHHRTAHRVDGKLAKKNPPRPGRWIERKRRARRLATFHESDR